MRLEYCREDTCAILRARIARQRDRRQEAGVIRFGVALDDGDRVATSCRTADTRPSVHRMCHCERAVRGGSDAARQRNIPVAAGKSPPGRT